MRIAVAGTGRLGINLLRPLLQSSHQIVAIVQDGRKTRGISQRLTPVLGRYFGGPYHMAGRARARRIPIFWIDRMNEAELAPLRALRPDILLVGGFGIILKPPLLELPRLGCVNTHSSLLPKHRGPNPFYAVILAGEEESGVTFHIMEEGIDTGAIIAQFTFPIHEEDGMFDVYNRACECAAGHVVEVMDHIEQEGLAGTPQDESLASYDKKPIPADAWIDWNMTAAEIHRLVRAMSPTPMPKFQYRGRNVRVARTRLISIQKFKKFIKLHSWNLL